MTDVTMTVNGQAVSGNVEGRTLLSEFLREDLRLTGTHVGCDTSQCGACVVHVNGEAVKSCTTLAADVNGANVITIEGMANADGSLSALLKENPTPTEHEIREYLEGNICRCTGYHNIVKAIMAASGQDVSAIAAA